MSIDKAGSLVLLEFTKAVLRNTETYRTSFIRKGVKEILSYGKQIEKENAEEKLRKSENFKDTVREKIKEDSEVVDDLREDSSFKNGFFNKEKDSSRNFLNPINIPSSILPETVRHVKPVPRPERINLGRLNHLLNDPFVKSIECSGPDNKIIVRGVMGRKFTSLTLDKKEVDDVITAFSRLGKIPIKPGIFRIVFGNLLLSAMISDVAGSKFIIKKIPLSY
ncbi:MAG: hypothetical protein R6U26_04330 [Candidatus Undinarchaeales archaeon]